MDDKPAILSGDASPPEQEVDRSMCPAAEHWFDEVLESLHAEAYNIANLWWSKLHATKATAPRSEWGSYAVRARIHKGGLNIEWYRLKKANLVAQGSSGDSTFMLTDHVRRGRKYQCSSNALTRAVAWEQALFEELEPQFAALRAQAAALNRARGAYRRYKKSYSKAPAEAR